MFLVVTVVSSREVGCGGTPKVWRDLLTIGSYIAWDAGRFSRPEPNLDTILLATGDGIESTFDCVEILAVRIRLGNLSSATLVEVEAGIAVRRYSLSVSTLVSHQRVGGERKITLAQVGIYPLAWYIREEYATRSSSARLRERPAVYMS